jgi:amino acid transporter
MGRTREEAIRQDTADLHGLGYAQELLRSMGGFSNFAISFSIISILTGAVILYDYGLAWAGKAAVSLGWPLVTIFVLAIAASMAELASAYPTAGGLYYWASKMKGKGWGWWTAWLNLIGQFAIVAGINYAAAGFINATIIDKLFGGTFNTFELLPNVINGQLITMGALMLIQLAMNIAGINLVALLNQVSVWWHIAIVAIVAVAVTLFGKADASGLGLFDIHPLDTAGSWSNDLGDIHLTYGPAISYPVIAAFFFSLLQANWTYTGYDASAHVAEETIGARVASAWGVFLSVAVSAVVGYIFLMVLSLHTPELSALFPASLDDSSTYSQYYFGGGVAVISILVYNLGDFLGNFVSAGIAIAMAFCGLSSVAAAGRMLFAFARDDGLPGAGWLKKVSHRYRTPGNSLAAIVVVSWLFTVAAFAVGAAGGPGGGGIAIVIVTAISTIFLYAAYGVVIYLGATTQEWTQHRTWSLGRWSRPIAWIAVFWILVLMALFSFPTSGNISWPFMVGIVVLLLIYYFAWARARFKGPRVMGAESELAAIEKEFQEAAGELAGA